MRVLREKVCLFENATTYKIQPKEQEIAPRYVESTGKDTDVIASVVVLNLWDYTARRLAPLPLARTHRANRQKHPILASPH